MDDVKLYKAIESKTLAIDNQMSITSPLGVTPGPVKLIYKMYCAI